MDFRIFVFLLKTPRLSSQPSSFNSALCQNALGKGGRRDGQVGQAVGQALAAEGAALGITARSRDHVEARAGELRASGARVLPVAANLADETEVQRVVDRVISEFGRIDVLVNLAGGLTRYKAAVEHTLEDCNYEIATNLLTAYLG